MKRLRWLICLLAASCLGVMVLGGQERVGERFYQLTDAVGPRVVGSPALEQSRKWMERELGAYGLKKVWREKNGPIEIGPGMRWNPRGWAWTRLQVQQMKPWETTLIGVPVLYSGSTKGAQAGRVEVVVMPRADQEAVAAFIGQYRGKLRGKFLLTRDRELRGALEEVVLQHRYSEAEMQAFAVEAPPKEKRAGSTARGSAARGRVVSYEEMLAAWGDLHAFLEKEGVLGLVGSGKGLGGSIGVRASDVAPVVKPAGPPMFDLSAGHYNRLLRLLERKEAVEIEVDLRTEFYGEGSENLMAEIEGTEGEMVIAGAHLDSWHGGSGASDNAANVAVLMEAARVLAGKKERPRRSIRFAFWDGEEFGLVGSREYVARHLADAKSKEEMQAYFNLDYGGGRIRGVYLQGRMAAKPLVQSWLDRIPGEKLVASPWKTLGSDQASFERAGVPGLSFIQDPMSYEAITHHSTMDVPEYVSVKDLQYNVRILVQLLWAAANSEERLPR